MKDDLRPLVRSFLLLLCCSVFLIIFTTEFNKTPKQKKQYAVYITTKTPEISREVYYRVKEGDTIRGIAGKFIVHPYQLAGINNLKRKSGIKTGQILIIPQTRWGFSQTITIPSIEWEPQVGEASWYGEPFHGREMANGQIFDKDQTYPYYTAAHNKYPFGMKVRVTNLENGKSIVVVITDTGSFGRKYGRIIDLSEAAAKELELGIANVLLEPLSKKIPVNLSFIPQTD